MPDLTLVSGPSKLNQSFDKQMNLETSERRYNVRSIPILLLAILSGINPSAWYINYPGIGVGGKSPPPVFMMSQL
jgi:hypothetical protein